MAAQAEENAQVAHRPSDSGQESRTVQHIAPEQAVQGPGHSRSGAPAVRLDMDLDVDVQLKAKMKGDITLSILYVPALHCVVCCVLTGSIVMGSKKAARKTQ